MYDLKQVGRIWGSLLISSLLKWGFEQTKTDSRALVYKKGAKLIILIIAVDDMMFVNNALQVLNYLNGHMSKEF